MESKKIKTIFIVIIVVSLMVASGAALYFFGINRQDGPYLSGKAVINPSLETQGQFGE